MNFSKNSQPVSKNLVHLYNTTQKLKKLRAENPYALFLPHEKQQEALNATTNEVWMMGGNRSGKTECMYATLSAMLTGQLPSRRLTPRRGGWLIYLCCKDHDIQRDVIQEKLMRYLPKHLIKKKPNGQLQIYSTKGIYEYVELFNERNPKDPINGTKLIFKTYDSGTGAFESSSVDAAFLDEEPPKPIYEAILARLLDRKQCGNGWYMCAMTPDPDKGMTWTFDEIVEKDGEDKDRVLIEMSTYDNQANIGREEIQKLESMYDESTRKSRIYGRHSAREGFVLKEFRYAYYPDGHIIKPFKPDWRLFTPWECSDWGYKHPWHWGFYAINRDGEVFKIAEIHQNYLTVPDMKSKVYKMRAYFDYKLPLVTLIDPNAMRKESTGESVVEQLGASEDGYDSTLGKSEFEQGKNVWIGQGEAPENRSHKDYIWYPIVVMLANNDRDMGWVKLNERLKFEPKIGRPGMFYTDNCVTSIKEAKNLTYPPDSSKRINKQKEIARKRNDDAPDADRYLSNANPFFDETFDVVKGYDVDFNDEEDLLDGVTAW